VIPFGIALRRFERAAEALWLAAERPIRWAAERSVSSRASVSETVQLLANSSDQLEYERSLTNAGHAPSELISMFCDDLYHPKDERFLSAFSDEELRSLAHLYGLLCEAALNPQPSVSALLKTPSWRRVLTVAQDLSERLGARRLTSGIWTPPTS